MGYYDLAKSDRVLVVEKMMRFTINDLRHKTVKHIRDFASNNDTYIRKNEYQILGKLYLQSQFKKSTIQALQILFSDQNELVRQMTVNAFGEIGKIHASTALPYLEKALYDSHHQVRNAVIGSLKKMGQRNALPVLRFAKHHLNHPDYKVRRQVIHGIELRGRTHPEDVLPILEQIQFETNPVVRRMIIHVLGQISYKKNCLPTVVSALKHWKNKGLVQKVKLEIMEVHEHYAEFSALAPRAAKQYIDAHLLK